MAVNVRYHTKFLKAYKKRIEHNIKLDKRFNQRLGLFLQNPQNPILKDHALSGSMIGYRAFSITGDIRAIYEEMPDGIRLYDIGTHNQVY